MKSKKEPIILAVLIIGLILYLFMREKDRTNYELPDIREIPVVEISGIEISGPGGNISLKKKDNKWYIDPEGFPADNEKVQEMLEIIKRPVLATMVSESENYARYGLEKDKKIIVEAFKNGTPERVFEIGDTTDDKRQTFIKISDDHRVFHSLNNIRSAFETEIDDLRDKSILSFDKEEITEISITKGDQVLRLVLNPAPQEKSGEEGSDQLEEADNLWQDAEGSEVKQSSVEELLYRLSMLSCEEYIYDITKEGLDGPLCTICLKDEKEYTLSIFSKTDNDSDLYPAVSSENDYAFELKGSDAEEIMNAWDNILENK